MRIAVGFISREGFGIDQVAGLLGQRAVDRDEVRALQQLEDRRASVRCALASSPGRPAINTSISKPLARLATACPIRPAPMIPSVLPLTERPSRPVGSQVSQVPSMTVAVGLRQPARGGQQQREREVGGRVGQHVGRVADRDPARGGGVDVDVVVADGVVGDRLEVGGVLDQRGVDPVGDRGQERVRVVDVFCELLVGGRQPVGPDLELVLFGRAGRARGRGGGG